MGNSIRRVGSLGVFLGVMTLAFAGRASADSCAPFFNKVNDPRMTNVVTNYDTY